MNRSHRCTLLSDTQELRNRFAEDARLSLSPPQVSRLPTNQACHLSSLVVPKWQHWQSTVPKYQHGGAFLATSSSLSAEMAKERELWLRLGEPGVEFWMFLDQHVARQRDLDVPPGSFPSAATRQRVRSGTEPEFSS